MNKRDRAAGTGRFGRRGRRLRGRLLAPVSAAVLVGGLLAGYGAPAAQASCANPVACENALPGTPESVWDATGSATSTIYGFADPFSVNIGQTVSFKIKSPATSYKIDIYRMGYYGGNGARLQGSATPNIAVSQAQPACNTNTVTGLVDCGNWSVSATWTVPSTAVSGVYFAKIYRTDGNSDASQIPFVVRNDASHSAVVYMTSDETWQAYNDWGGYSVYAGKATGSPWCCSALDPGRAVQVSYNRPFATRYDTPGGQDFFFGNEFSTVRFLEANGYDVSYVSQEDVAASNGASMLEQHKALVNSGHSEYWDAGDRANVTAARDAGVNLAFFAGNLMWWKTRWAASQFGNEPERTMIVYKESLDSTVSDPADPPTWTGEWRDPRFSPPADGGNPENAVTGQLWSVNCCSYALAIPAAYSKLRLWRNTSVAALAAGQTATMPGDTLGYEWDSDIDNGFRPAGEVDLSKTCETNVSQVVEDYQEDIGSANECNSLTLYRAASGAVVFDTGSVQWSWGLDSTHDGGSGNAPSPAMQQATVNLLADMGAQPSTLQSGLTAASASTDTTAPVSAITSPSSGASLNDGTSVTISGTATDSGGGVVAGVEVSADSGKTWHPVTTMSPAASSVTWSYTWIAHGTPATTIESRATDDSGNIETPSAGVSVNVGCPCSIWAPSVTPPAGDVDSGDANSVELGVKFTSDSFGVVSGIRFYKSSGNTGTHVGSLWTADGQLLASATFTGETASGWQQVNFSRPVFVNRNTTYVAAYFAPKGHYSQTEQYVYPPILGGASLDAPPLHVLHSTASSGNGLFLYTGGPGFPTQTSNGENYWVDVVFAPTTVPGQATNVTATAGFASAGVTWTAPSTGGPVTTYTVTPYIGTTAQTPVTVTGNPAPTSTVVGGLSNGSTYTFTVTASNGIGSGPESAQSNAVTPSSSASLVINGGFESGLTPWTASGSPPPVVSTAKAHSGTASALIGTVQPGTEPLGDSSLSETIAVPSSGTTTLSFWYWPSTTDTICSGSGCVFDWQEAQIRSTSGATLAQVFKSDSNSQTWTQATFNLSPYAGQSIQLWFNVHEDGSSPPDDTWMYLDDVTATNSQPSAPSAPGNVAATAGNASASVSWTAPASNGSPITSYTVTPYIGTTAQPTTVVSGSPPATSATITGLTNGTTYTFTVTATNGIGTSQPSSQSNAVTPSAAPPPAPAFVQQAGNHATSVSSISATPAANVTAGDLLVVMVGVWGGGSQTASSVTDSAGDTYTKVLHFTASDGTEMSVWTAPVATGGTKPAITAKPSSAADVGIQILEYSGLSAATGAAAIDQLAHASGTTSSAATVQSGATAATTASGELAIGFYLDSGFGDSLTAGTGFTKRASVSPTGDIEFLAEDQPAGLGATPNAAVGTGARTTWLMATLVFRHA